MLPYVATWLAQAIMETHHTIRGDWCRWAAFRGGGTPGGNSRRRLRSLGVPHPHRAEQSRPPSSRNFTGGAQRGKVKLRRLGVRGRRGKVKLRLLGVAQA